MILFSTKMLGFTKNLASKRSLFRQIGFTLIELLVVISILGVLAAALIATIDPFEQLKRAQDTQMKNVATEFLSATTRYYANHNALPWHSTTDGGANCYSTVTLTSIPISSLGTCVTELVSDGELKQSFTSVQNTNRIFVTNPNPQTSGATDSIVCFLPQSKAQRKDPNAKYTITGDTGSNCMATGGTAACYWCSQ